MKQNLLNLKSWLLMMCLLVGVGSAWAETKTGSWDLTSVESDWTASGNETYFSQPYGFKKANGTLTNKSIADFAIEGITQIKVGFKCLQNGASTSRITIYLVDKEGNAIGAGQEVTPDNQSAESKTSYKYATFTTNLTGATGFMMKVTTFGKNILINGAEYEVTYTSGGSGSTPEPTKYDITIANDIANGTVTASPTSAKEGDEVTLTATPNSGYEFGSWNVTNASTSEAITVSNNKFTMPAASVNVSATFNKVQGGDEPSADYLFYESFDKCSGTGGNDDKWTGQIATTRLSSDKLDKSGWGINTAYEANKCARFGTGSDLGSATTPTLGTTLVPAPCGVTLSFKAAAWNGNNESTTLKLSVTGGGTLSDETMTLKKGEWTEYQVTITGFTASTQIKFAGEKASNSRFFLDEVYIKIAGAQEIPNLIKTASADLFVGDEIADLNTYLNLPSDYTGTVSFSTESSNVEIDNNYLLATAAGTATINVTASAVDGKYLETTGEITLNISKKTPVLTWEDGTKASYTIFSLADNSKNEFVGQSASATDGATVKYKIEGTGATIEDGLVTITGAGTATITAYTEETAALNAATTITYTLNIVDPSIAMTPEDGKVSAANNTVTFTGNGVAIDYVCCEPELSGNATGTTISVNNLTTGGEFAVTIKDDAANNFSDDFEVKYLKDAALQFSASELRVLVGTTEITEPTLTKATDAEVTYSLVYENPDNEGKVATIDPATGKLTLKKLSTETQGALTVKATTPATDEYTAGEATYELVVYRNVPTFTWSETSVTIDQDELDLLPTPIVQDNRNVVSLTSSNTDVATAAVVDGKLTITFVGYGTTTITGKTYATWDYAPAEATYELAFAPRYTVTFSIDGEETALREETSGAGVTPPTVEPVGDYTFAGWVSSTIEEETTGTPSFAALSAGKYMPTESTTLYAAYKRTEEGEGGSSDEGEFLIYADVNGTMHYMADKPTAASTKVNQITSTTTKATAKVFAISKKAESENEFAISYEENGTTYYLVCTKEGTGNSANYYIQSSNEPYYFTRSEGVNGTYRFTSTYNEQILAYRASTYNVFKMFKNTNVAEGGDEYFDLELEQISGGSTAYYTTSPTYSITIGQYEYATLVVPCNLDFTGTGVKAYSISALNGSNAIAAEQAKVPANKPIIVHGAQGTHKIPRVSEAADFETMLQAKDEVLYDSDGDEFDYFYLGVNNGNVCFKKLTSGSLAAGKCFIPVAKEANIKIISLVIDDEDATGISSVENMKMNNGAVYNLAGQRVDANTKGIIIVNGKKMFNK